MHYAYPVCPSLGGADAHASQTPLRPLRPLPRRLLFRLYHGFAPLHTVLWYFATASAGNAFMRLPPYGAAAQCSRIKEFFAYAVSFLRIGISLQMKLPAAQCLPISHAGGMGRRNCSRVCREQQRKNT
jgi:hypothetical protein